MLQKTVELEVTEFLGRDHYQRQGEGLLQGYRNGYEDKRVQTGEGPLHLKMPQVRNTIDAFESVWLQSLVRRSGKLTALIPQLLLHLAVGDKESTVCWKSFFEDMKQRGLKEPLLAVIDGNSGLRKAVRECFPDSWVQRCQAHRMRNILCKSPEKARPGLKKLIHKAFTAQNHKAGLEQAKGVVAMYEQEYPEAMKCLRTDLDECLTVLRFPEAHRKRIRTTNLLERLFGEGQRRSKVIPRFMSERSGSRSRLRLVVSWMPSSPAPRRSRESDWRRRAVVGAS